MDVFLGLEKDNFFCVDLTSEWDDDFFDNSNDYGNDDDDDDDDDDNDDNVDVINVSNDGEVLVTRVFIDLIGGALDSLFAKSVSTKQAETTLMSSSTLHMQTRHASVRLMHNNEQIYTSALQT